MDYLRYLEYLGTQSNTTAIIAAIISVVSLIASIVIGILNYRRQKSDSKATADRERFESKATYRSQILEWYHEIANLLSILPLHLGTPELETQLAKLSALTDQGRFYFPNALDESDEKELSSALQGKFDRAIMMLEWYHSIVNKDNPKDYLEYLRALRKMFTSRIFDVLEPRKFNKFAGFNTSLSTASFQEEDNLDEMLQRPLHEFEKALVGGGESGEELTPGQRLARKLFNKIAAEKRMGTKVFEWKSKDDRTDFANKNILGKEVQRVRLAQGAGRSITLYFDKEEKEPSIYLAAGGKDGDEPFPSVCHFVGKSGDKAPLFLDEYKKKRQTVSMLLDNDAAMDAFIAELKEQIEENEHVLK